MLAVRELDVVIDGIHVLRRVALDVAAGEAVCLVGRNGSGKSTTLRTIMGYRRPAAGSHTFHGEPIGGEPTPRTVVPRARPGRGRPGGGRPRGSRAHPRSARACAGTPGAAAPPSRAASARCCRSP